MKTSLLDFDQGSFLSLSEPKVPKETPRGLAAVHADRSMG